MLAKLQNDSLKCTCICFIIKAYFVIFFKTFVRDWKFSEGKPKDSEFSTIPLICQYFVLIFNCKIVFSFINFSAWYLAYLYKSSSVSSFVDLNCSRRFSLSFMASATSSLNLSWLLFLILKSLKGWILSITFNIFPRGLSMQY